MTKPKINLLDLEWEKESTSWGVHYQTWYEGYHLRSFARSLLYKETEILHGDAANIIYNEISKRNDEIRQQQRSKVRAKFDEIFTY